MIAAKGSRSSVVFDLDGDGDLDVVTNEFNGPPQVLISDLAQQGPVRFLTVRLQGTRSNRDGLGARVTLVTDRGSHLMVNDGKSGYLSQSRMPLYFGLGRGAQAEQPLRLEVSWPSGARQTVERPEAGQPRHRRRAGGGDARRGRPGAVSGELHSPPCESRPGAR